MVQEQLGDLSYKGLFEHVVSAVGSSSVANGYIVQNRLLFRKWVPLCFDIVGDAVFQSVVPEKFRPLVLEVAHDGVGHFGIRKTY